MEKKKSTTTPAGVVTLDPSPLNGDDKVPCERQLQASPKF